MALLAAEIFRQLSQSFQSNEILNFALLLQVIRFGLSIATIVRTTQIIYLARPSFDLSNPSVRVIRRYLSLMLTNSPVIKTLDELRTYVNTTLCEHHQLEVGAFELTERILLRGEEPCGIYFCLHGPRAVKFTAIWETEQNTILFYGSTGQRFHKIQLLEAPRLAPTAA